MGRLLVRGVHSTVETINPGRWLQAFVAELRSQIETENQQRPDQSIGHRYNRHFYIIYRGGRYAKISWRDDTTYQQSTAKMEAGNLNFPVFVKKCPNADRIATGG